jgi:hypothetical protein
MGITSGLVVVDRLELRVVSVPWCYRGSRDSGTC